MTLSATGATPAWVIFSSSAAANERSMIRPSSRYPRSVMLTTTEWLLRRFLTRTTEPNGSVGWQAVISYISNGLPLAVRRPLKDPPYQVAMPCRRSCLRALIGALVGATRAGGVGGMVAIGRGRGASA